MKMRMYAIPIAVVLLCGILALLVRITSFQSSQNLEDRDIDFITSFGNEKSTLLGDTAYSRPSTLIEQAEVIVRAQFSGDRMVSSRGLYTEVTVKEVYKGSQNLMGKQLCVIEEMSVFPDYLNIPNVYLPLQEGDDYLLLLEPVSFEPGRKLTELQKREYYPVSKSCLSAYRIVTEKQTKVFSENDLLPLHKMKGLDVKTSKQSDLNLYYQFRDELFDLYSIHPSDSQE